MSSCGVPKTNSSLKVLVLSKLIPSNSGGRSWPEPALRRLMRLRKLCCVSTCVLWISVETNTGEGLRSAVEGFEGALTCSKLLCNQSEIRDQ